MEVAELLNELNDLVKELLLKYQLDEYYIDRAQFYEARRDAVLAEAAKYPPESETYKRLKARADNYQKRVDLYKSRITIDLAAWGTAIKAMLDASPIQSGS